MWLRDILDAVYTYPWTAFYLAFLFSVASNGLASLIAILWRGGRHGK